jgi:hypothetical protein
MWLWLCEFGSWKPVSSARELQWDRRQPARTWSPEHGSWGIYSIGSRYQTTASEDTADWEHFVRAVVNSRVCESATALLLFVVTFSKCSVNTIINSNPIYNHSYTWQYRIHLQEGRVNKVNSSGLLFNPEKKSGTLLRNIRKHYQIVWQHIHQDSMLCCHRHENLKCNWKKLMLKVVLFVFKVDSV